MLRSAAVLGSWLLPLAAWAQLDCGAGGALCETVKYGLGDLPSFREEGVHGHAEFGPAVGGVSYAYTRASLTSGDLDCGPERDFVPYTGQILLRERIDCTPTGTGPACSGGANDGQPCHLVPGQVELRPALVVEHVARGEPGHGIVDETGVSGLIEVVDERGLPLVPDHRRRPRRARLLRLLGCLDPGLEAAGEPLVLQALDLLPQARLIFVAVQLTLLASLLGAACRGISWTDGH